MPCFVFERLTDGIFFLAVPGVLVDIGVHCGYEDGSFALSMEGCL